MWYAFEPEQDEGLEKLEETVVSTKHIALAVNEELDLHTRLIVCVFACLMVFFSSLCFLFISECHLIQILCNSNCIAMNSTITRSSIVQDDLDQHVDVTDSRLRVKNLLLL